MRVDQLVVRDAGPRRVHDRDAPRRGGREQRRSGCRRRAVLSREAILAGADVDHVYTAWAPVDPRDHAPVALLQVVEGDERGAQLAREPLVLPEGPGSRSLREHHGARLVHPRRRGVPQRQREFAKRERQVLLRRRDGQQLAQRLAGRDGVGQPRGHSQLVLDGAEAPVLAADQVEPRERDPASRRGAAHRRLVVR
jgi:hypothetical protein